MASAPARKRSYSQKVPSNILVQELTQINGGFGRRDKYPERPLYGERGLVCPIAYVDISA